MIIIYLGNVGSGKTLSAVRDMVNSKGRNIHTNIVPKSRLDHVTVITSRMIINKDLSEVKKSGKKIYDLSLNIDYWKDVKKPLDVVLDEAHQIMNPRRAMSKVNVIAMDWMALIRRVVGGVDEGGGKLVLITQLWRRLDPIARDMATSVIYHIMHSLKKCRRCQLRWSENSEMPERRYECPRCGGTGITESHHRIMCYRFKSMEDFISWKDMGIDTWYRRYFITDCSDYFSYYDTLSWDNMLSDLYE